MREYLPLGETTMSSTTSAWSTALLFALSVFPASEARAQPFGNPFTALQSAGERMEGEAESLQERVQRMVAGTRRGTALIRNLTEFRTAVNQFRTGVDVGADPSRV